MKEYVIKQRRERVMNHAADRYFERYGKRLTVKMYEEFIALIKSGNSVPLQRQGRRVVHDVNGVIVVYRKYAGEIITFLPPQCREELELNKTYLRYLDRVESGLGLRRDGYND